jgi:spermidine synthase
MSYEPAGALVIESAHDDRAESTAVALSDSTVARVLLFCFFLSGSTALVYEVICSRFLLRIFGATLLSSSTILAVFMAGLAIGAFLAGKHFGQLSCQLRTYALIELGIGMCGLLLALLSGQSAANLICPLIAQVAGDNLILLNATRCLLAVLVLGVPTVLIGATLPVLAGFFSAGALSPGREAASLYAANTTGAVVGTAIAGFFLLPNLGLAPSLFATAGVNLLLAIVALWLSRVSIGEQAKVVHPAAPVESAEPTGVHSGLPAPVWLIVLTMLVVSVSGALSMMLELAWIRFFCLVFGSSTYAFSCVLAVFLAGLSGGSWLSVRFGQSRKSGVIAFAVVQCGAGVLIFFSLFVIAAMPWLLVVLQNWTAGLSGALDFTAIMSARTLACALAVLPPAVFLGAVFPTAVQLVLDEPAQAASRLGRMYACSTTGAIAGAWLAGFVVMPAIGALFGSGIQTTILLCACAEIGLALVLYASWQGGRSSGLGNRSATVFFCLLSFLLTSACFVWLTPRWDQALMSSGVSFLTVTVNQEFAKVNLPAGNPAQSTVSKTDETKTASGLESILFYREGANTTVSVGKVPAANIVYLKNDGKVEVSVPADPDLPSPSCDLKTQVLLGQLPILISRQPVKTALVIGFGSGTTCGSMLKSPDLKRLTVAELEPSVLDAERFFSEVNGAPLKAESFKTGRISLKETDGRYLLASTTQKYDAIVSQPAEPWVNGAGDLFTTEFWTLGRSRLATGGLFCQWIQLYSITPEYLAVLCRTFAGVFPECVVFHPAGAGELILIGWNGTANVDAGILAKRLSSPAIRKDLLRVGLHQVSDLIDMMIKGPSELKAFNNDLGCRTEDHRLNTDDNLLLEFDLPKQLCSPDDFLARNLEELSTTKPNRALFLSGQTSISPEDSIQIEAEHLLSRGKFQEAKKLFESLSSSDPLNVDALWLLGYCQLRLNEIGSFERYIRASLKLDPNQFLARLWLSKGLLRSGQVDEGLRQLRIASCLNPGSPEPPLFACAYFAKVQNWRLALANLTTFQRLSPNDSRADILASVVYSHLGQPEQARAHRLKYEQALPGDRPIRKVDQAAKELSKEIGLEP